ncbi:MAG: O-antigen ligase family protein [Halieaceae bacterium]|jgi:O-antigen ligase|nr:O-antigen ligase family protein [Halieaceae bacterium]
MEIRQIRGFLLDRGMLYLYSLFIAGYFLLPMASGHRRLYYLLVFPAILLLWRELLAFYRRNLLLGLLLAYTAWMMLTLAWTADFSLQGAGWQLWLSLNLLSFVAISGYLWVNQAERIDLFARRLPWLAAAAALVSIAAWYAQNPFPSSRLEPLGVMHHQNKAGAAYGLFLVLSVQLAIKDRPRRAAYAGLAVVLAALVLLTQSRTALAGVCMGLLVLLGWRALLLALVGGALSWALLATNPGEWSTRVETFSFRPGIWAQVLADMKGHWLFGRGYLTDPHVNAYNQVFNHAHNSYLATLRDGGLVGLLLLLALLGTALVQALRLAYGRGERLYLALLLYGMTCIFMDFDRLFVHPKEMWLYLWLPLALVAAAYPQRAGTALPRLGGSLA